MRIRQFHFFVIDEWKDVKFSFLCLLPLQYILGKFYYVVHKCEEIGPNLWFLWLMEKWIKLFFEWQAKKVLWVTSSILS